MTALGSRELANLVVALDAGVVIAAPTESSYGLLADARNPLALDNLLSLKPRGPSKGQPLIVPDERVWRSLVARVPPNAERLAARFWPGPLTLVLPAQPKAALDARVLLNGTLAVRIPGASQAAQIVGAAGRALTATSANSPGTPPALTAEEVAEQFPEALRDGRLLVTGSRAPGGAPSTLVQFEGSKWTVLRAGAIGMTELSAALKRRALPS